MVRGTLYISPPGRAPGGGGAVVIGRPGGGGGAALTVPNDGSGGAAFAAPVTASNVMLSGAAGARSNVGARLDEVPTVSPGVSLQTAVTPDTVVPGTLRFASLSGPLPLSRGGTGASNFLPGSLVYMEGGRMTTDPALRWDEASQSLLAGARVTFAAGSNATGESAGYSGRITFFRTA